MTVEPSDRAADAARYEVISGGYDEALFAAAAIPPAGRVLDIGCGYGATSRRAARLAARGSVLGNDIVEPLLVQARAFADGEGLGNLVFEAADAQTHPFPRGEFDVTISRFGMMFFRDPVAAFGNVRRALQADGRLVFTTVGPPEGNDLPGIVAAAMPPAPAGAPPSDVHSLSDPDRIAAVLGAAGFADVRSEPVETSLVLGPDAEAAASFLLAWGAFGGALDEAAAGRARAALADAARPFETPGGVRLRSTAWLVTAV
ncbi:class I SAM-dependent methyltransferase [Actinomadura opuntiae]|uniref:class I SAM-dependent methyltransferase n=1 Tax=Actinomadura sp. OS1-43 TaxID=604315 RepID=UPI00255B253E|nr:class I SAM-dependent methyltransferase [Actinomadura sp. OS1-43]MDL4813974.1 class I SAM-dependent methyltransferase [Actinomadura sp. OS1-43]